MIRPLLDPANWKLPNPKRVIATLKRLKPTKDSRRKRQGSSWNLTDVVPPVDFYAYLKWRFGDPNGVMMTMKIPSVDNFIHWHYTIESSETIIEIMGLDVRTEIRAHDAVLTNSEWKQLESNLKKEFDRHRQGLSRARDQFERWHLFVNPYSRLSTIIERHLKRLDELGIASIKVPDFPSAPGDVSRYSTEMRRCLDIYQEAASICVSLQMIAPVMGEAAINFLMLVLAKTEVRNDSRLYEDFSRRNIDVRIKSLHLCCDGFSKPIDGSEEPFKAFLRLMNRRNDSLHGNIDPNRSTGEEIYFDHRTIPLVPRHRGLPQLVLANAFANLSLDDATRDVESVRKFVDFLLFHLKPGVREPVAHMLNEQQLGYRPKTKTIGAILPQARMDVIPARKP
jgi:hypothetical protein